MTAEEIVKGHPSMTDYLQKARERVAGDEITPIAHIAELLEALDKAEAERDALRQGIVNICNNWVLTPGPEILQALRTLIQPEPDPLVAVFDAIGIGPGIREDFRKELARHGLAVKEVG